jgi:HSP20 family protein
MPLSVENGMVTAKGRKKSGRGEKGDPRQLSERRFGSFGRSFRLPADADADADEAGAKADPKDGVPTVRVPRKAPAAPEARRGPIGKG